MDFHALPRRDLQALCKRNGVRANMTNSAMADALRALPAVDGIEEYVKQPVAVPSPAVKPVEEEGEQREKYGSPRPRGRSVTVRQREPVVPDDEGEKQEDVVDLKLDSEEEKAPEVGVERRGPSRRTRTAAVVAPPTTRRRAAASSSIEAGEVAAEAVPARTTRRRAQGAAPEEAEEKEPRGGRTSRRAAARKTGMQPEEEKEISQDALSDVETEVAVPVSDEGFHDPVVVEEATGPQTQEESAQEDEGETPDVVSDVGIIVPTPVFDEVRDDAEAAEEATEHQNKDLGNSGDEASQEDEGEAMNAPTQVEEEMPVVEECDDESAVQEPQANVQQCAPLVEQAGGAAACEEAASDEEMSDAIGHADSEEMEMVPIDEAAAHDTLTVRDEASFTGEGAHANDGMVPIDEAAHDTLTVRKEVSFTGEGAHANEEPGKEEEGVTHAAVSELDVAVHALVSDEVCDDAEDVYEATEPQNGELNNAVEEPSKEDEGLAMDAPTPGADTVEECKDKSAEQELPVSAQQSAPPLPCQEDSAVLGLVEQEGSAVFLDGGEGPLGEEASDGSEVEEMEPVPVDEEHRDVACFNDLLQHGTEEANGSAFGEKEDETVHEVLNDTVSGHETVLLRHGSPFGEKEDGTHEVLNDTVSGHETVLDFSGKTTPNVEAEGMVSTVKMPQSTVTMGKSDGDEDDIQTCRDDELKEVVENEGVRKESVFSVDVRDKLGDGSAIGVDPTVYDADDVAPLCMTSSNLNGKRSNEMVAVEEENEMKYAKQNEDPLVSPKLKQLSLRKLRAKLKEKLIAGDNLGDGITSLFLDNMVDDGTESVDSAIADEPTVYEAEDVAPLCMGSININGERSNEMIAVKDENEINYEKQNNEMAAVEEDNEMKYEKKNKEPPVSTKLSLRTLRAKLKVTLIAHKRKDEKRVALGRLDKNVC